jgi:hypothetical protein
MIHDPPSHLADKYRLYAIWLEEDFGSRPNQRMMIVHIGRPVSFATLIGTYLLGSTELTIEKTGEKLLTSRICGVQKVKNDNTPQYELTTDAILREI